MTRTVGCALPAAAGQGVADGAYAVEALDLSGKGLRELPAAVCRASSVEELCLEDNALVTLPEGDDGRHVPSGDAAPHAGPFRPMAQK